MDWKNNLINSWEWTEVIHNREAKERVASEIVVKARDGQVIGAGSGSTVYLALLALAEKIRREKIRICVIPASEESRMICTRLQIPQTTLWEKCPDWTMDGADEVSPACHLIKGRGGAMFKEKLLIRSSLKTCIIVDKTKLVDRLGEKFPIPVEVFPPALVYVQKKLEELGGDRFVLRPAKGKDGPVITENGNFILDVFFKGIDSALEQEIKKITGVIESGLFIGYPIEVIVADAVVDE